jgi:hypothetical protein
VWSVDYEQFKEFAAVEDLQDPEQFPELVEGKSLLRSCYPITTCNLFTPYLFAALH